jgi:aldehyde:ferredoxin oxidoreductase
MGPSYNIIKMDVKGTNLNSSRVLKNLAKLPGFTPADGWELRTWTHTLKLPQRGKNKHVTAEHVRPYLMHVDSLVIITVQLKAWMDSAGICMWADVQLGPYYAKEGLHHLGQLRLAQHSCYSYRLC